MLYEDNERNYSLNEFTTSDKAVLYKSENVVIRIIDLRNSFVRRVRKLLTVSIAYLAFVISPEKEREWTTTYKYEKEICKLGKLLVCQTVSRFIFTMYLVSPSSSLPVR